jgi:SSS family solute:Na+ symporter
MPEALLLRPPPSCRSGITTIAWLITAFVGPGDGSEGPDRLRAEGEASGPGWTDTACRCRHFSDAEIAQENRVGAAFVGWIAGCVVIWSSLFAIGNFLYSVR